MYRDALPYYITDPGEYFEDSAVFAEKSVSVNSTRQKLEACGTVMTQGTKRNEFLTTLPEQHTFVIGETGSGKTRRVVLPTIRLLSKTGESMVITDPKGELYRYTASGLKAKGYQVLVLDLRDPLLGNRYNPLGNIDRLYHSGDTEDREEALIQLKDVIRSMKESVHDEKQLFWENVGGNLLQGIMLLILRNGREGDLSFWNTSSVFQEIPSDTEPIGGRYGSDRSCLKKYLFSLPEGDELRTCMMSAIQAGTQTRSSIFSVTGGMLAPYADQDALRDSMQSSDIRFEELGQKPAALYLILPDYSEAMYTLGTMYVEQIYQSLVRLADSRKDGRLPNRVTFLLDEFANFARIPDIASMLTAARSRGIRFTLVCQSMEQLMEKYGKNGAEIMMANCREWIYMNCRNLPFLERLVQMSGDRILPDGRRIPLVTTARLMHLSDGEVYVLNDRCRPYFGYLPDYSSYDFGEPEPEPAFPKKRTKTELSCPLLKDLTFIPPKEKKEDGEEDDDGLPF